MAVIIPNIASTPKSAGVNKRDKRGITARAIKRDITVPERRAITPRLKRSSLFRRSLIGLANFSHNHFNVKVSTRAQHDFIH